MNSKSQWTPSAAMKRRAAKRKSGYYSSLNAAGVAALLVALLFIWIGQPHVHSKGGSVDMVKAENAHYEPGARREDAMIIAVERDGKLYFAEHQVELNDIPKLIHDSVQAGSEKKVYVRPDARAKTGDVARVFEEIQRSGITNVAILTEKLHPPAQP